MTATQTGTYRVIAIQTNDFGAHNHGYSSRVDETIKWSGTDLDELSRQYPPSDIFGADPLGYSEIEDGLIRYNYRFERQTEDGSWEEIDDPRRRITPVTELEQAMDAENRRLFPGDYITAEDEEGHDYDGSYYCDNCCDAGCSQCDSSPDCSNCDDRGCEQCDPEAFPPEERCNWCGRWFEVRLLTEDDLCTECEKDRLEELKPHCADCGSVTVDNAGDICRECDDYWHNQYKSYYRWYKRLWRWVTCWH